MPVLPAFYKKRFQELEQKLVDPKRKNILTLIPAYIAILLAISAVVISATGVLFMAPAVASGLGIGGFVFLNIIGYGLINDMLACRDSIEYFRFGHQPGQREEICIPSTNKDAQAFYWGILATWIPGLIGAIIIGVCAGVAVVPLNSILLPIISVSALSSLVFAHFYSKKMAEEHSHLALRLECHDDVVVTPPYTEAQRNWIRCGIRNELGYGILPLIAVGLTVALIVQAAAGIAIFIALPMAAPILPLVLSIPIILLIGGLAINYIRHKNTVDPRETLVAKFDVKNEADNANHSKTLEHKITNKSYLSPLSITTKKDTTINPTLSELAKQEENDNAHTNNKALDKSTNKLNY